MTMEGISNSLNMTLSRINTIESNLNALQNVEFSLDGNEVQSIEEKQDFQTILDEKLSENDNKQEEVKINNLLDNLPDDVSPIKKEVINLKSKIDLKAQSSNIDEIIETFANKYDVDSDFIKAVIQKESGFNPNAKSKKGAIGLMQLMPATAKSLGVVDAYNPSQNIEGGVKYLKGLLDKYDNNRELALAAYNAGSGAVKKYGGIPPYKETQNYVNSIMSAYTKVKEANL